MSFQTGVEEMFQLLKGENLLLQSQLDDMKAVEMDSQATINNQEITINSLKTEKEVGIIFTGHLFKLNSLTANLSNSQRSLTRTRKKFL